jgi:D-alanine-D-alanine ligase-like ATP-grasp enzyme
MSDALTSDKIRDLRITTRLIAQEAKRKGYSLDIFRGSLDENSSGSIIRGRKNGRELFFLSSCTALTPAYGYFAAENKLLTYNLLRDTDIPVPETIGVSGEDEKFVEAINFMGKHRRVVVKPAQMNHADGITMDIDSPTKLKRAITYAREISESADRTTLVQEQVSGLEYRFLVLSGRVIAVAGRRAPRVIGDGKSTIDRLIDLINSDPLRKEGHASPLTLIDKEDVAAINGREFLQRIPTKGETVQVLSTTNLSKGGDAVDYTDEASEALKKIVIKAARKCSMGLAGVDIITDDIKTGDATNSYVLELNLIPGIRMHMFPSEGKPRDVAKMIFREIEKTSHPIFKPLSKIGRSEYVSFPVQNLNKIPARIDTGAAVSAIDSSDVSEKDGMLSFKLFNKDSEFYTGEIISTSEFKTRVVWTSTGEVEKRFMVKLPIIIKRRKMTASFTLANRSKQSYPVLVGRNILKSKFVVDISRGKATKRFNVTYAKMNNIVR